MSPPRNAEPRNNRAAAIRWIKRAAGVLLRDEGRVCVALFEVSRVSVSRSTGPSQSGNGTLMASNKAQPLGSGPTCQTLTDRRRANDKVPYNPQSPSMAVYKQQRPGNGILAWHLSCRGSTVNRGHEPPYQSKVRIKSAYAHVMA
jgi:hypothetical protein